MTSLNHVGIAATRTDRLAEFLRSVCQLELARSIPLEHLGVTAYFFEGGTAEIELVELETVAARRERLRNGQQAIIEHIALEVPDLEEARAACARCGVGLTDRPGRSTPSFEPLVADGKASLWTIATSTDPIIWQLTSRR